MSQEKKVVNKWPKNYVSGAKRANISESLWLADWFVGWGKDESCQFEGTWWYMVCFARNVLASENTKISCPEFYHPEMANNNYCDEPPYLFEQKEDE